jgi:dTDP-4-amino-4,6-dideoxygalactose transaminase
VKSLHGQTKDAFTKTKAGAWKYDVVEPGYKFNMTDIAAAMGLVEIERYDSDMLVRRKQIFDRYANAFSKFDWAEVPEYETKNKKSSYHVFLLRIKGITERERDEVIRKITNNGVSVNVHFIPLPMMTYYKNTGNRIEDFAVSYDNFSRVISLPVYYDLTDKQVDTVVKAVVQSCKTV